MKIRNGFVSNSSSTSFCIAGTCLDESEIAAIGKDADEIDNLCSKNKLECYRQDEYCSFCIGVSIDKMDNDETKAQFLKRAEDMIEKAFGKRYKTSLITDGWYNG